MADVILIAPRDAFADAERYYAMLFHELAHWSGHRRRLRRLTLYLLLPAARASARTAERLPA